MIRRNSEDATLPLDGSGYHQRDTGNTALLGLGLGREATPGLAGGKTVVAVQGGTSGTNSGLRWGV